MSVAAMPVARPGGPARRSRSSFSTTSPANIGGISSTPAESNQENMTGDRSRASTGSRSLTPMVTKTRLASWSER